jgi:hypothetical protein
MRSLPSLLIPTIDFIHIRLVISPLHFSEFCIEIIQSIDIPKINHSHFPASSSEYITFTGWPSAATLSVSEQLVMTIATKTSMITTPHMATMRSIQYDDDWRFESFNSAIVWCPYFKSWFISSLLIFKPALRDWGCKGLVIRMDLEGVSFLVSLLFIHRRVLLSYD